MSVTMVTLKVVIFKCTCTNIMSVLILLLYFRSSLSIVLLLQLFPKGLITHPITDLQTMPCTNIVKVAFQTGKYVFKFCCRYEVCQYKKCRSKMIYKIPNVMNQGPCNVTICDFFISSGDKIRLLAIFLAPTFLLTFLDNIDFHLNWYMTSWTIVHDVWYKKLKSKYQNMWILLTNRLFGWKFLTEN